MYLSIGSSLGEVEHSHKFSSQLFACLESFREQDDFSDLFIVWLRHGHWSEQLLQVVR